MSEPVVAWTRLRLPGSCSRSVACGVTAAVQYEILGQVRTCVGAALRTHARHCLAKYCGGCQADAWMERPLACLEFSSQAPHASALTALQSAASWYPGHPRPRPKSQGCLPSNGVSSTFPSATARSLVATCRAVFEPQSPVGSQWTAPLFRIANAATGHKWTVRHGGSCVQDFCR